MGKISKNRKASLGKIDAEKRYDLLSAAKLLKEITTTKFDSSIDVAICLGVDPKKSDQIVRGTVKLPHGTGKKITVLALCTPDQEEDAKKAGADQVGLDEYIDKISKGWADIDVIVTTPSVMPKIGKLGKILGPRNLMPNPKIGTVTNDLGKTIKEIKSGKIEVKINKDGIIHTSIGKASFKEDQIIANAKELIQTISKLKPPTSKGVYFKSISISTTMSPGIFIEPSTVVDLS